MRGKGAVVLVTHESKGQLGEEKCKFYSLFGLCLFRV